MKTESVPSQQLYEEIRDVPASQDTLPEVVVSASALKRGPPITSNSSYEEVWTAGLQAAAETPGTGSYQFTLCSAYGVSLDHK